VKQAVLGAVKSGLADSQFRAGIDLVSSAALNAVAGLAFWFVAARAFDESVVGVNAALISTMAAVASFASLGMKNGLIRFLPEFGASAKRLVQRTYAATGITVLVTAPIVAAVLARRVEELETLGSWQANLAFTLACFIWIIFVLQDSVLIALEKTALIPIANVVHALAKLALLVALAFSAPYWGIFAAWTLPVIAIVVWVNVVSFRALRSFGQEQVTTGTSGLARFAAGEHASMILSLILLGGLPIYILAELGESASAFYALAWTIAYNLMLVNSQVSTALLAAASQDGDRLPAQATKAIKQMALFVVPGALVVVAFASFGLGIFGSSYADGGTTILRLFAVAAVANIAVAVSIGILRARRQVGRLVGLYALRVGMIFGLSLVLVPRHGLAGVGWAWLIGETALAALLVAAHLRPMLRSS
jgi:O-antigen/teichoic acid export membrane protein